MVSVENCLFKVQTVKVHWLYLIMGGDNSVFENDQCFSILSFQGYIKITGGCDVELQYLVLV